MIKTYNIISVFYNPSFNNAAKLQKCRDLSHMSKKSLNYLISRRYLADISDNICVAAHFVSRLDPVAKLLSGTPVPTRARVTANQNKTRASISGSLAFERNGILHAVG